MKTIKLFRNNSLVCIRLSNGQPCHALFDVDSYPSICESENCRSKRPLLEAEVKQERSKSEAK
jgi:hypothetical protein